MELKKIKEHFERVDPIISQFIDKTDFKVLNKVKSSDLYFEELCQSIIFQQLAGKAADTIMGRFIDLFKGKKITPNSILSFSEKELKSVGLSWQKTKYIIDLSQKVKDKEVDLKNISNMDDYSVLKELTKVKGIGPWTAEMFLMFTLGREDIFSYGDLILRKAVQRLYKLKDKASEEEVNKIVNKWTPYKSYGSLALWMSADK